MWSWRYQWGRWFVWLWFMTHWSLRFDCRFRVGDSWTELHLSHWLARFFVEKSVACSSKRNSSKCDRRHHTKPEGREPLCAVLTKSANTGPFDQTTQKSEEVAGSKRRKQQKENSPEGCDAATDQWHGKPQKMCQEWATVQFRKCAATRRQLDFPKLGPCPIKVLCSNLAFNHVGEATVSGLHASVGCVWVGRAGGWHACAGPRWVGEIPQGSPRPSRRYWPCDVCAKPPGPFLSSRKSRYHTTHKSPKSNKIAENLSRFGNATWKIRLSTILPRQHSVAEVARIK